MNQLFPPYVFRVICGVVFTTCLGTAASAEVGNDVPLHGKSKMRFASREQAEAAFRSNDRFLRSLSKFDVQVRLQREDATVDELLDYTVQQYVPWSDEQKAKLADVIASLAKRLEPFNLPVPEVVLLVQTNGKVESNAAYCRGNAIILPTRRTEVPAANLEALLAHELFHVLSSHNPQWRYQLYKIIGFQQCAPIPLAGEFAERKLTNPDAPELDCVLPLHVDGQMRAVTPLLYAKSAFMPESGLNLFQYLQFQLLVVEPTDDGYQPLLKDGEPWFVSPAHADFAWNIGVNTGYIIHPEEVMADNFKLLVMKVPDLPTPRITQQLLRVLSDGQ